MSRARTFADLATASEAGSLANLERLPASATILTANWVPKTFTRFGKIKGDFSGFILNKIWDFCWQIKSFLINLSKFNII